MRSAPRAPPPPAPRQQAPPPAQHSGYPGLMGSMMSGMATGMGFSMANRAVDAVVGPRQMEVVHTNEQPAPQAPQSQSMCQYEKDMFSQCLQSASSADQCDASFQLLKQCQANPQSHLY